MKIEILHIYSQNFHSQKKFYQEILNLPVTEIAEKEFHVHLGYSILKIHKHPDFKPYHIAFHIPDEMENQALDWLKNRVEIVKSGSDEIIDFFNWHAKSIYFYDADYNIIEFISRKDLLGSETDKFSKNEIIGIAEIGLAVDDVKATYHYIRNHSTLIQYFGDQEKFCVIGTDRGLLICVDQNSKTWFPTKDRSEKAAFEMKFSHKKENYQLKYDGKELEMQMIL